MTTTTTAEYRAGAAAQALKFYRELIHLSETPLSEELSKLAVKEGTTIPDALQLGWGAAFNAVQAIANRQLNETIQILRTTFTPLASPQPETTTVETQLARLDARHVNEQRDE